MALSADAASAVAGAKCFTCVPPEARDAVIIYILAKIAGGSMDPKTLVANATCFNCIPKEVRGAVMIYLLNQINAGGGTGGGGGDMTCGAGAPVAAPATPCASYIDTNTGTVYYYYLGAWH